LEANHKKILKAIVLELRHMLEGYYSGSDWHAGDLEQRLNALGVWRDRNPLPADELAGISDPDREARKVVDAYLKLRDEAGVRREEAVAEFVRETAYTWANRLLALRCMEARELIDEVILQKDVYGGRSLEHNRLAQRNPELCTGADDGLFALLDRAFAKHGDRLPTLFDPNAPGVALKPGVAVLRRAIALLSGTEAIRGLDPANDNVFRAPDTLGWAYQYYQQEEKRRVDEWLKTKKGFKCEGADLAPKTALYTESYMVKFLVENSLGATWAAMKPETALRKSWKYFVSDADCSTVAPRPVREITFLDPACGSGHFLLEAFDLFYEMYEEEGELSDPTEICRSILQNNLFGIDIDERAIQISEVALWMKAAERVFRMSGMTDFAFISCNLVAANIRLPRGVDHLKNFLLRNPEDRELSPALEVVFNGLQHVDELGSLVQIERPVEAKLKELQQALHQVSAVQAHLYQPTYIQGQLPVGIESFESWTFDILSRLKSHFHQFADTKDPSTKFFGRSAERGLLLVELLARRYDIVLTNPPYLHCSNFGTVMRAYIYSQYSSTSQDLYAAFMVRCVELTKPDSFCGIVSQQSFMFLERHSGLREYLYDSSAPHVAAHLGSGAFTEISGEVVNVILIVLRRASSPDSHGLFYDLTGADDKPRSLQSAVAEKHQKSVWKRSWSQFQKLPGAPIVYSLSDDVLEKFSGTLLEDEAVVPAGMVTGENNRFVRFWWEISGPQWQRYMKGGEAVPWFGNNLFVIDASPQGFTRMSSSATFRAAGREHYGKAGITYSAVSTTITARLVEEGALWDCGGPMIIPNSYKDIYWLLGAINSSFAGRVLHKLNPTINIKTNDVKRLPSIPAGGDRTKLALLSQCAVELAKLLDRYRITSCDFQWDRPRSATLSHLATERMRDRDTLECGLSLIQAANDRAVNSGFNFDEESAAEFNRGYSVFPMVSGYTGRLPLNNILSGVEDVFFPEAKLVDSDDDLIARVQSLYDTSVPVEADSEPNPDEEHVSEVTHKLESRNSLEAIGNEVGIHVLSVYWIVRGALQNCDFAISKKRTEVEQVLSACTLRALGHRWQDHRSSQTHENGVFPLAGFSGDGVSKWVIGEIESLLLDPAVNTVESELRNTLGLSLQEWLENRFFVRHLSDFKKRPVFWQLTPSQQSSRRRNLSVSLVLVYRFLDFETLPTIQSQYVRPQRQRFETEIRGIEAVPVAARSDRQQERLSELFEFTAILRAFDDQLENVARLGFCPQQQSLRQFAVDDATLCLKARWLQKLSSTIKAGPLATWCSKADTTKLHQSLAKWIADSMLQLRHHCSEVGPAPPKSETLEDDPTSESLALLITKKPDEMVQD